MIPGCEGIMEAFDLSNVGEETVPAYGTNAFGIEGR
jgi:hypothetical protein